MRTPRELSEASSIELNAEELLKEIIEDGFFIQHPAFWNEKTDASIKELLDASLIRRATEDEVSNNTPYAYVPN